MVDRHPDSITGRNQVSLFFFGDSICFGQGVSPHVAWVTRVSATLAAEPQRFGQVLVQNPSVNGNTTRMALERMAYDIEAHRPDILYVQFGMNDCNVWQTARGNPRTSRSAFAANLAEICARARSFGTRRLLLGTNHPSTRDFEPLPGCRHTYQAANRAYNEIIRDVAKAEGADLIDHEAVFEGAIRDGVVGSVADLVLPDGVHLSDRGHDIYLQTVLAAVIEALEALHTEKS